MWKRVIWTAERIPQTTVQLLALHCTRSFRRTWSLLKEVETRYCSVVASKFADPEMMIGGVIIPANIARANASQHMCSKHQGLSRFVAQRQALNAP